jgi:hypothetical protein
MRDDCLIDDLTVVEIAGGPHNVGWTHPHEVNSALISFLESEGVRQLDVVRWSGGSAPKAANATMPSITIRRCTTTSLGRSGCSSGRFPTRELRRDVKVETGRSAAKVSRNSARSMANSMAVSEPFLADSRVGRAQC